MNRTAAIDKIDKTEECKPATPGNPDLPIGVWANRRRKRRADQEIGVLEGKRPHPENRSRPSREFTRAALEYDAETVGAIVEDR